jgi:hypothetical protein
MDADKPIDLYMGPKSPAGKKGNWPATPPGRSNFASLCLDAPTELAIKKTWKPGDISKVKRINNRTKTARSVKTEISVSRNTRQMGGRRLHGGLA